MLAIEPSYGLGNHFLGRARLAAGHYEEAVALLRKSDELLGRVPFSRADLGYALAVSGGRAEAEAMLAEMVRCARTPDFAAFSSVSTSSSDERRRPRLRRVAGGED